MTLSLEHHSKLQGHSLFSALDEAQRLRALEHVTCLSLEAGDHLFHAGQEAELFYFVCSGQVKLYRLAPNGMEKVVEIVRPGQTFAEALMFLELSAYPVGAQALGKVEVIAIHNRPYLEVLASSPQTSFHVMAHLSMRLKGLLNEIDSLTLQNANLRVVNYLLYLLPDACEREGDNDITLPAAKNIIASRLSVQPETLSRILAGLSNAGLIRVDGLNIQILDVEALRHYV